MRTNLSEEEKIYIEHNIFKPMEPDLEKVHLFGNVAKAQSALESSLLKVRFDKKSYRARVMFVVHDSKSIDLILEAGATDCQETVFVSKRISL